MSTDLDTLWASMPVPITIAAVVLAAVVIALVVFGGIRLVRGARAASGHWKLRVGTAVVQAGVTWAVVTGTYAFCEQVLDLPGWEAAAFAVFLEAATWVTVGMIIAHGRAATDDGRPTTGLGPAGPFFWLFSLLGGTLATMGGATPGAMVGRAVIVIFGTSLWYLTLLTYTRPDAAPSRFRWTPRRLLVAIGALEPADQDVADQHEEWQIRRLARAMRLANTRQPLAWFGRRALIARAEQASEHVIEAARRRYAVAHLLVTTISPESEIMQRVLASVQVDPAEAAREAAERAVAAQREREAAAERDRERRLAEQRHNEELALQREREQRAAELEMARIAASAAAAQARDARPSTRTETRPNPAQPPARGLTQQAREWILEQWEAGKTPTGTEVEEAVGATPGSALGRKTIANLKKEGHTPPSKSDETAPAETAETEPARRPLTAV